MSVRFTSGVTAYSSTANLPAGDFTICLWMYLSVNRAPNWNTVWSLTASGDVPSLELETNETGNAYCIRTSDGTNTGSHFPSVGAWYRVGATRSGSTLTFYTAAAADSSLTAQTTTTQSAFTPVKLAIGTFSADTTGYFDGRVANFKQYSAALTSGE